jgi:hypothetical protein
VDWDIVSLSMEEKDEEVESEVLVGVGAMESGWSSIEI